MSIIRDSVRDFDGIEIDFIDYCDEFRRSFDVSTTCTIPVRLLKDAPLFLMEDEQVYWSASFRNEFGAVSSRAVDNRCGRIPMLKRCPSQLERPIILSNTETSVTVTCNRALDEGSSAIKRYEFNYIL